jgi:predicted alpha/beta-fold hydrolase
VLTDDPSSHPLPPVSGHLWTVGPTLAHRVRPQQAPASQPWQTTLHDAALGTLTLRGLVRHFDGARACLVVVHGLGGSPGGFYCVQAARAAEAAGLSCLRMALRGADRAGEDFYHAGLTADLTAALASEALQRYERLYVLGYSLGGHMSLRHALAPSDPRLRAVAAICPPIDLTRSTLAIDSRRASIYRRHVLSGLNEIYAQVASRRPVPTPLARVLAARTIREWDSLTVVPRHGFDDVDHYYRSMSVGPRLAELALPTRIVHSSHDPMVPGWTYQDHLARAAGTRLVVELLDRGGHVGFPAGARVESRTLEWLLQH